MAPRISLPLPLDRSREKHRSKRLRRWITPLKFGFPVVAIMIFASVVFWPHLKEFSVKKPQADIEKLVQSKNILENKLQLPRMRSLNKKGRAYVIQASTAKQSDYGKASLSGELERPHGEMELDDGSLLKFWADMGHFSQNDNLLHLSGNVHVITDKGYDFHTQSAALDFARNIGEGHDKVTGTGPTKESIEAEGFKIMDKGEDIQFIGRTSMTLYTK